VDIQRARELARELLAASLPRRWAHTQGVAAKARALAGPLDGEDAAILEASAWLHDVGYSPALVDTGFHPLDGARFLRDHAHGDRRIWTLVAHHTGAVTEAEERGLLDPLVDEFPIASDRAQRLTELLTECDLTVGPSGEPMTVEERVSEILHRYPPDDPVHRATLRNWCDPSGGAT
jgi:HD superfamily phosphodiesterase